MRFRLAAPEAPSEVRTRRPFYEWLHIGFGPVSWVMNGLFLLTSLVLRGLPGMTPNSLFALGLLVGALYLVLQIAVLILGVVILIVDWQRRTFDPAIAVAAILPPVLLYVILLVLVPPA